MKQGDRTSKNGIDAAVLLAILEHPANPAVVDFRPPILVCLDRQLPPLTTEVQQLQDVVKDRVQRQDASLAAAADHKMRQDKLLELHQRQIRRNPLPRLTLLLLHPKIFGTLSTHSPLLENPQLVVLPFPSYRLIQNSDLLSY